METLQHTSLQRIFVCFLFLRGQLFISFYKYNMEATHPLGYPRDIDCMNQPVLKHKTIDYSLSSLLEPKSLLALNEKWWYGGERNV